MTKFLKKSDNFDIPTSALESFVASLQFDRSHQFNRLPQREMYSVQRSGDEELPASVIDVIERISEAGTVSEKLAIAHSFSLAFIENRNQYARERRMTFEELSNDPVGDCDDYANMTMGLLLRAGLDPRAVFMIAGEVTYIVKGKAFSEPHMFVAVEESDNYYIADNNLVGIALLDPSEKRFTGVLSKDDGTPQTYLDTPLDVLAKVNLIAEALDGRGSTLTNAKGLESLRKLADERASVLQIPNNQGTIPASILTTNR